MALFVACVCFYFTSLFVVHLFGNSFPLQNLYTQSVHGTPQPRRLPRRARPPSPQPQRLKCVKQYNNVQEVSKATEVKDYDVRYV